jgi:hypothetical protein
MQILIFPVNDCFHALDFVDEVVDLVVLELLQYHHEADAHDIAIQLLQRCLSARF